jgi:transposase
MAMVGALLQEGADTAGPSTAATCKRLLKHEPALWAFVRAPGIEPTNNRAEQAIRTAVIWRKLCFGTQTSAGSRYVERVLTVVATCRLQQRPVLDYLIAVAAAAYAGLPSPALLSIHTTSV